MSESYEVKTKEFHWNGHDGSVRNGGLYGLLYTKPTFSFQYDTGFFTDLGGVDYTFTFNNTILQLTASQVSEVVAFIEEHAKESPWEGEATDTRLLFEQVTSLHEVEVTLGGNLWIPFYEFLQRPNVNDVAVANALLKARTKTNRSHSFELFTQETKTNNLNGFIPTIDFEDASNIQADSWLFKMKKMDDEHVSFTISSDTFSIQGHSMLDVNVSPVYYGFSFTGEKTTTLESVIKSPDESFKTVTFIDSNGTKVHRFVNEGTGAHADYIAYDKTGKLTLPEETYFGNKKVEFNPKHTMYNITKTYQQETITRELHIYPTDNNWIQFNYSGSSYYAVNIYPRTTMNTETSDNLVDLVHVLENIMQDSRPINVNLMNHDMETVNQSLTILKGQMLHIVKLANTEQYLLTQTTSMNIPMMTQLEEAIFMGEQEVFINELQVGGI